MFEGKVGTQIFETGLLAISRTLSTQKAFEVCCTDWFDQMVAKARFLRRRLIPLLTVAGHGDQSDGVPLGSPSNFLGEFVAAHPRHGNVRENQDGLVLFNHRQGFGSARRCAYLLPPGSQDRGDRLSGRPHIVHNQDAVGWKRFRLVRQIV